LFMKNKVFEVLNFVEAIKMNLFKITFALLYKILSNEFKK
jgi:hypothetical protein